MVAAADQQQIGRVGGQPAFQVGHHVIDHQTLVIHRVLQGGDEFADDGLGIQRALGAALLFRQRQALAAHLAAVGQVQQGQLAPMACAN